MKHLLRGRRSRTVAVATLSASLLAAGVALAAPAAGQSPTITTTTYPSTDARFANPERGFYRHQASCDDDDFSPATLSAYRTAGHATLVMCVFYLEEFRESPISQAQLDRFARQAAAVRQAGLKMVVRFAYTASKSGLDAAPARVQAHLNQLAPYLRANADVIAVVQSGFIGAWGEGYYSQNFGDQGAITAANWAARKAVVDRLLSIMPASREVQLRTPLFKRTMFGTLPATSSDADADLDLARVGHHNDCFISSRTDQGTFADPATEYPYLAADTAYVSMGGETCAADPLPARSDCPTALDELGRFHYTYLNADRSADVLTRWTEAGCMPEVDRRLGYRFRLVSVTAGTEVSRGMNLPFSMTIRNDGWSGVINPRPVRLILRNTTTGAVHVLPLTSARKWLAGGTYTLHDHALTIPSIVAPGTYTLLLSLPDPMPSLTARPEYAVRLANAGTWEPATGYNSLLRTVLVR